ncbi:MAG TPA: ATP-binding protein [Pyrinomonadaceae bacterium]|nr:ATP-binding protein [Pyrinomonadaceae bacterium]
MSEQSGETETGAATGGAPRKRSATWFLGGLVLVLLSALVILQVYGLWEIFTPDTASDTLLIYGLSSLNFVAFFIFSFIFVRNLLKLRRERRARVLGSKIRTRLVVYFIAVSLLPITAMALFSFIFLNRSLEKWFGRLPEEAVRDARVAQREDARQQEQHLLAQARVVAAQLDGTDDAGASLSTFVERGGFAGLALVAPDGAMLARSAAPAFTARAQELDEAFRRAAALPADAGQYEEHLTVAAAPLADGRRLLAARASDSQESLSRIVAGADTFEQLRQQQRKVRLLGLSTLGLITLLLVFAATWTAIHLARGISTPIRALAEAADLVAGGDLAHRVTTIADDELALLAASFNQMTAQLAENRRHIEAGAAELREKNIALAERRDYIETVLESLSTGVVSLDESNRVTTINAAAVSMLHLDGAPPPGAPLAELLSAEDKAALDRVLLRARLRGRATVQTELARGASADAGANGGSGGVIPVALTATALSPRTGERGRGVVLVMEDLSELLTAQRAAAWSEVARRMAHEIKNPLTPIQLSAERIARNFLRAPEGGNGTSESPEARRERVTRVVEDCTATISREVAGLKAMVDEFSRFARLPHARLEAADLNEVVRQALALYEDRLEEIRMDVRLAHALPPAMLDIEQIRRVFVNLLDNAIEALAEVDGERRITVATGHDPARGLLLAEVTDTGHGIARTDFARLFQPYFTTRGRGTGLGLAIVQRILSDHSGRVRAESNRPRGARMIIELPVAEDTRDGSNQ